VIDHISNIPEQKRVLLEELMNQLSKVTDVAAIVLGGSYAAGTHHEASDMDIGLYYFEDKPFLIDDIRRIAQAVSVEDSVTVTDFYEWGPWVNGGAWIHTRQGKVDFLYCNMDQVQRAITEVHQGIVHHDYDQQSTNGFYSIIYLAETQICVPLFDPDQLIVTLKDQVKIYPPKLKQKMTSNALRGAEFTLLRARAFATTGDIYNTVGCLTHVTSNLTQALFALNEKYFLSDKKVMDIIARFPLLPEGYAQQVNHILACPGSTAKELIETISNLEQVWRNVVSLAGEFYQPKYQF